MSRFSPLPPSHTKAIWLPSGEKAGSDFRPGKLVKGMNPQRGRGRFRFPLTKNLYSPKGDACYHTDKHHQGHSRARLMALDLADDVLGA
jgi:hypothetical protein